MTNIYMVRECYNDDWGTDIRFYYSTEQAYQDVKRIIDELTDEDPISKRIKQECYEELDASYAANPEDFWVEEVAFVSKIVIIDNLTN